MKALPENLGEARRLITGRLSSAGIDSAVLEADWILQEVTGLGRARLLAGLQAGVEREAWDEALLLVDRRARREPLQYVLGSTGFYGREFRVNPSVLIPRPETELLVETTIQRAPRGGRVLEIGTGSGCVAITVALERPDLDVVALDISSAALDVARANAEALGAKLTFVEGDAFGDAWIAHLGRAPLASAPPASPAPAESASRSPPVAGAIDLLISNPPYVPLEDRPGLQPELAYEPEIALYVDGGPAAFVDRLAELGERLLVSGGVLLIETHAPEAMQSLALLEARGFRTVRALRDLSGRPRVLEGTLTRRDDD